MKASEAAMVMDGRGEFGDDGLELAWILVREVSVMFLMLAMGILCKKAGLFDEDNARALSNVLLLAVIPVMMIHSLQIEWNPELLPTIGLTFLMAVVYHVLAILLTGGIIRDPGGEGTAWRVSRLAAVFSNAGFMGFPLLAATVGDVGLVYGALYLGVFNVVSWVWCVPTLTGGPRLSVRQLLKNPVIIAFLLGMVMLFFDIRLPGILDSFAGYVSNINTPVSMILIGVFLASVRPREVLTDPRAYLVVFLRNIFFPGMALLLFWVCRISTLLPGGKAFALSFLIVTACPSAATTILMSARYRCDSAYGAKLVALSTVLSIVTIPLLAALADKIL